MRAKFSIYETCLYILEYIYMSHLHNIWLKGLDKLAIICHVGQSGALRGVVGNRSITCISI